jgi:hypothetical protein
MSKVSYNQSGYVGSSMSIGAMEAYEAGERPKSRWTKALMLDAIGDACRDAERVMLPEVSKLRKDEVFSRFFVVTSWHHTSKYANETDFYGVDEMAVEEASRPMTENELSELRAEREAAEARARAEEEKAMREWMEERAAAEAEVRRKAEALGPVLDYLRERNPNWTDDMIIKTMAAYEALEPERYETRIAKSGRVMLRRRNFPSEFTLEQACSRDSFC